jgi:ribonuclease P protein component
MTRLTRQPRRGSLRASGAADETHLPAPQHESPAHARLPQAQQHQGRAQGTQEPTSQGPVAANREHVSKVNASGHPARPVGCFPATQRIRKRREFQEIQAQGRRFSTPSFTLLVYARGDASGPRLGITVSRKVGRAVLRSRTKRLIREAFRATRDMWPSDCDLVIIAHRAGELSLQRVVDEWRAAEPALARRMRQARADAADRKQAVAPSE